MTFRTCVYIVYTTVRAKSRHRRIFKHFQQVVKLILISMTTCFFCMYIVKTRLLETKMNGKRFMEHRFVGILSVYKCAFPTTLSL